MWRSSELSISKSIPVILPARLGCIFWINGKRRSPGRGKLHVKCIVPGRDTISTEVLGWTLTKHLLLLLWRSGGEHGGGQWLLPLHVHSRLRKNTNKLNHKSIFWLFLTIYADAHLLHGNLRLRVHVLLRVANAGCVFVLRHTTHWWRSCGSRCSCGPWTHSLCSYVERSKMIF